MWHCLPEFILVQHWLVTDGQTDMHRHRATSNTMLGLGAVIYMLDLLPVAHTIIQ